MKTSLFLSVRSILLGGLLVALIPLSAFAQGTDNPTGVTGVFNGNSSTGCSYNPYTANATRAIPDLTVAGAVGAYPLQWTRFMNSRRAGGGLFGGGGGWSHSYQWSCTATENTVTNAPQSYTVTYPDGRIVTFAANVGTPYLAPPGVTDRFGGVAGTADCYLSLTDGGAVYFHQTATYTPDPENPGHGTWTFVLSAPTLILDPYGLPTTLTYISGKLTKVTEPGGRALNISYATYGTNSYVSRVDTIASDGHISQWVIYTYVTQTFGGMPYTVLTQANYISSPGDPVPIAYYTYQTSNTSTTGNPLINTCKDVRYPGPMKNIAYTFVRTSPLSYGELSQERNANGTSVVDTLTIDLTNNKRTETRPDGASRTFTYGATLGPGGTTKTYLLKSYTDFAAHTTTLSYDANGYVASITDANSHVTSFERLPLSGVITKITHPVDLSTIQYFYTDATGAYLEHMVDELGHITYYKRTTGTMTTYEIDYFDGGIEKYTYNGFNQVLTHTMPSYTATGGSSAYPENYSYNTTNGLLLTHTPPITTSDPNPSPHPTRYHYDVNDHVDTITDPRNNVTTLYHNEIGQLTFIQHPTDNSLIGYVYNADGTLQYQNVQLNATDGAETDYTYDDYNRVVTITNPTGHSTNFWYDKTGTTNDYTHTDANPTFVVTPALVHTANAYDGNLRLLSRTVGDNSSPDSAPATTSYAYDPVGNLSSMNDPKGNHWIYGYDARDRLFAVIDPIAGDRNSFGYSIYYTYDFASNKKLEQRANDQTVNYDTYDNMNRLLQMTVSQGTTPAAVTHYTWTRAGKLDTMTDPGTGAGGNLYSYTYDAQNRLITTTYPAGGGTEARTYDFAGNLATYKNRAGNTQTFIYDTRNRETRYDWNDGVTPYRALTYDDASRMTTCTSLNAHSTFVYYADSLMQSETETNNDYGDGTARTVSYTYDADGRRATTQYPSGRKYSSGYTPRSEPRTLYDITNGPPTAYQAYYLYDLAGDVSSRRINNYQAHTEFTYGDALNRLTLAQEYLVGSTPKFNYGYDKMSNRTYEQRDGASADGFGYDANNQLTSFIRDGTLSGGTVTGPPANTHTLSLDASGNRTSTVDSGTTTSYARNNLNQYYPTVGSLGTTYDGNANLKTYNGWTYTYDAMNRLTAAVNGSASANFWYDGLGRICTWQQNGSGFARFNVYDGWNLVEEYTMSKTLDTEYLHGAGRDELVSMTRAGVTSYFFQDGRGNTAHAVDTGGNLVETCTGLRR